jgi:hypothetical protein
MTVDYTRKTSPAGLCCPIRIMAGLRGKRDVKRILKERLSAI